MLLLCAGVWLSICSSSDNTAAKHVHVVTPEVVRTHMSVVQVYAYDQRFHGDSDSPSHGFHVARLAADLRDFLTALELTDVTVVGSSMGCAVIWSYVELFGLQRLKQAVFLVSFYVPMLVQLHLLVLRAYVIKV
jgi:pimeloyl-ACP methyl ester carboxylesterase